MANNRSIQFKRNKTLAINASAAKSKVNDLSLLNGEIVISTYATANNTSNNAKVIGIKANDTVFYVDNQTILDKIGIDDNGNVNPLLTGDTILKTIDHIEEEIADISSGGSAGLAALSGKSITNASDTNTIDFSISDNTSDGTKQISGIVKVSEEDGNIIVTRNTGIYSQVDYNSTKNVLIINGIEKPLNAGGIIDDITYSAATESLVITYHDTSGTTHTVSAPLTDLIEEYDFKAADANHNVSFTVTRDVSGSTSVQGEINLFDCGEYE